MLPGGDRHNLRDLRGTYMFSRLDLHYASGPAQRLTTTGEGLDGIEHDLSALGQRARPPNTSPLDR